MDKCTWCYGSGEWAEDRQIVPCSHCDGTGLDLDSRLTGIYSGDCLECTENA